MVAAEEVLGQQVVVLEREHAGVVVALHDRLARPERKVGLALGERDARRAT